MDINTWNISLCKEEAQAAYKSIMNRRLSEGANVKEFEKKLAEFLGRKFAICVPNGTSALLLAMMGIGIRPDDEVIVPDFTFIATGHAPKLLGAKVVLADTEEERPLLDITKALVPVHLNGRRANTKGLKEKLKGTNIWVVDDAAQAFASGCSGNYAGVDADIACYSFAVTKIMTTAQGGVVVTDNEDIYKRMKKLKMQGMEDIFESNLYELAGFNLKYTDILAAIGMVQLAKIKEKVVAVKENYRMYCDALAGHGEYHMLPTKPDETIYTPDTICRNTKKVRDYLESYNIQVRPAGACLHTADYFEQRSTLHNSVFFSKNMLYMPGGPDQPKDNIKTTIEHLLEIR